MKAYNRQKFLLTGIRLVIIHNSLKSHMGSHGLKEKNLKNIKRLIYKVISRDGSNKARSPNRSQTLSNET